MPDKYHVFTIRGETDDGEPFIHNLTVRLPISPDSLLLAAKAVLWDCQWIPGSVSWRIYDGDTPLKIGENY